MASRFSMLSASRIIRLPHPSRCAPLASICLQAAIAWPGAVFRYGLKPLWNFVAKPLLRRWVNICEGIPHRVPSPLLPPLYICCFYALHVFGTNRSGTPPPLFVENRPRGHAIHASSRDICPLWSCLPLLSIIAPGI